MSGTLVVRAHLPAPASVVSAYLARPAAEGRAPVPIDPAARSVESAGSAAAVIEERFVDDRLRDERKRQEILAAIAHRHEVRAGDLQAAGGPPLTVAISGASGFIGAPLGMMLEAQGHRVLRLVRRPPRGGDELAWDPAAGTLDEARLAGVDAVVNLAGESIAGGRWTDARKRAIRESRLASTGLLAGAVARLERKPRVMISASAIGIYGVRGDEPLDDAAPTGDDFLADVGRAWEAAADPARAAGVRVAHPRLGLVLSPEGGALMPMLRAFRAGVGGRVGSGRQIWSWVARDDALWAIAHALQTEAISGPFNVTAPGAVPNADFARLLGAALGRPALVPLPGAAVKVMFGEMGQVLLLGGQRVIPRRLEETGFRFRFPTLDRALAHVLCRARPQIRVTSTAIEATFDP